MSNNKDNSTFKNLLTLVLPIAFQNLMSSAVSASDAIMLGFVEQDSLSAASLAGKVAFVLTLFIFTFSTAATVLGAQYWGKKDMKSMDDILGITMRYSLVVGLIFTILSLAIPKQIMGIFTSNANLINLGAKYLRMVALSYLLASFSQVYLAYMKACERVILSSVIGSVAVVINIILNGILIFGLCGLPKMGIEGAALATVLARGFEVICAIIIMITGKCIALKPMKLFGNTNKNLDADFLKYGTPILFNQLGWGIGVTMYSVIMGHLGTDATAANAVADIVRSMTASLCWGFGAGVGIILGNMLGKGELEKAKKEGGKYTRWSIWIGIGSGIVILLVSPVVLSFANLTPKATDYLRIMLMYAAYYIIGNSINSTVIAGIFACGGDTKFGMICDIITLWVVILPMGFLGAFVFKWPVLAVAAWLTLDEFVKIPAVYRHYKKYKWVKNITREN